MTRHKIVISLLILGVIGGCGPIYHPPQVSNLYHWTCDDIGCTLFDSAGTMVASFIGMGPGPARTFIFNKQPSLDGVFETDQEALNYIVTQERQSSGVDADYIGCTGHWLGSHNALLIICEGSDGPFVATFVRSQIRGGHVPAWRLESVEESPEGNQP